MMATDSPATCRLEVDGTTIRYAIDGDGPTVLILIHGAGAHRLWWHAMSAQLVSESTVVTVDLSGHGDSDHRENYGPSRYGNEIIALAEQLKTIHSTRDIVLVGHSMGGRVAVVAAARRPDLFGSVVLLDTIFPPAGTRTEKTDADRRLPTYRNEQAARDRFRLVPAQPALAPAVIRPVVDYALINELSLWRWKFDPLALWRFEDDYVDGHLADITVPITYAYGTSSTLASVDAAQRIAALHPLTVVAPIVGGHHHLPLDSPQQCVQVIQDHLGRTAAAATRSAADHA